MGYIKDEILQAVTITHATVVEIGSEIGNAIRNDILSKYTRGHNSAYLWQDITDDISVQDTEAWRFISEFVQNSEAIMFFDREEENLMFLFRDGSEIVPVLAESVGFEFYITNSSTDYLICFNHHDYLIATGTAAVWLRAKINKSG